MKVYIAGPINGMPNGNREAFAQRAKELIALGHEPLNPWDIGPEHETNVGCCGGSVDHSEDIPHQYGCYLRADIITFLQQCDGISLLEGWQQSKGATVEEHVARAVGLKVIEV